MFKLAGSIMIILSSVFIFSRKSIVNYCTADFLKHIVNIIQQIDYKKFRNLSYDTLFKEIGFDYEKEFEKYSKNIFICQKEIDTVNEFFGNIGKRDREAENKYLKYSLETFDNKQKEYFKAYTDCRKINLLGGMAMGLFIVLFLI